MQLYISKGHSDDCNADVMHNKDNHTWLEVAAGVSSVDGRVGSTSADPMLLAASGLVCASFCPP